MRIMGFVDDLNELYGASRRAAGLPVVYSSCRSSSAGRLVCIQMRAKVKKHCDNSNTFIIRMVD